MRTLILVILCIFFLGCNQDEENKAELAIDTTPPEYSDPNNPTIDTSDYEDLRVSVEELESNFYVGGGVAHPTNGGDVIEVDGLNYKRAIWENGDAFIEEGTMEFVAEEVFDHDNQEIRNVYKIVFTPSRYNPTNCGYTFDSYEKDYSWESNGSIVTQWVDIDVIEFHQSFGWPTNVQPDYVEANLNNECL